MTYKCYGNEIFKYLMKTTGALCLTEMMQATHMGYRSVKRLQNNEIEGRTLSNLRRNGYDGVLQFVETPDVSALKTRTTEPKKKGFKVEPIPLFTEFPDKPKTKTQVTPEMIQAVKDMTGDELVDMLRRAGVKI